MPGIFQGFADVRPRMPWWILGMLTEAGSNNEVRTALNAYPQAVEVTTVQVANVGDGLDVTIAINGVDTVYNTATGQDAAAIGAGLAAAINANPLVRGRVAATFATTTLTLTALTPNDPITVSIAGDASAALSAVTETQASAAAAVVEFGRAVVRNAATGNYQGTDELVAKAASAVFTAQVVTATYAFVSTNVMETAVYEIRGAEKVEIARVIFPSATDLATSLAGMLAALNTDLPANTVNVTGGVTNLVFTAEVPGFEFVVEIAHNSTGASPAITVTETTGPSASTSFHRAWRGVTIRDQATAAQTVGGSEQQYQGNSALAYVRRTQDAVVVESSQAITPGDNVFVELGVTADNGKFFNTTGSTRIRIARSHAVWNLDANADTGSLAALRLTL